MMSGTILKSYWSTKQQFYTPYYSNTIICDQILCILRVQ